jgi:4-diphosphocytidyl-2-C-methyl-D-erythritol kinase
MRAPAKLNLCLRLGERRPDGLHELRSLFCPLALSDRIVVAEAERDEVVCPGIQGPDLAAEALARLREAGWARPPLRIEIDKRIPIAAGLGGGSADAAAVLRLAGEEIAGLDAIAASLGADVPSQLAPGPALVGGAGERVEPLPAPAEFGVVLIPASEGLATADVYAEADRLGLGRKAAELETFEERLRAAASAPGWAVLDDPELLVNDLEPAALSLRPEIATALEELREAGAGTVLVAGSGPTAAGIFEDAVAADRAAATIGPRHAATIVTFADPNPMLGG